MKIDLKSKHSHDNNSTLVIFSSVEKRGKQENVKIRFSEVQKLLTEAIDEKTITGKFQEAVFFRNFRLMDHKHLLVVGLGSAHDGESLRQVASTIHSTLKSHSAWNACIQFDGITTSKRELPPLLQAFVEGALLTDYSFDELKSKKTKDKDEKKGIQHWEIISKLATDVSAKKAPQAATIMAESVNFSRRLGDLPGNLMTPSVLADTVTEAIKGTGIKAEIWDRARIKKERMGGLYGVAQGSHQEPRFIILKYNGAAKSKKPVVLVGKGLTFDTGGISIKPSANMEEMKFDMCGGANVLGALLAIAKLKLKVNAYALVPATENMPGGSATKPGDIHTGRNGKTFEVNNTDAEGRLILADALSYGSELNPAIMVDAATLTGAMVVALGNTHTGYFTKNETLNKKIQQAATSSGEWVWRMPLCEHHTKDMKGTYADLSNISSGKGAGSATAAAFLEQFVGENIPWAHFDIAGTGWAIGSRLPYCSKKGASGVILRTFVELAKLYQ